MSFAEVEEIGKGGFAKVWKCTGRDGKTYAKKVLNRFDDSALKRFENEIRFQTKLDHPNIVKVLSMDLTADPPYYIMPLYETSLEKRFSDVCGNEERISPLFRTILLAMEFAHEQGILHRDLKPENILIYADLTEIAIGDFGVGRNLNSESSRITARQVVSLGRCTTCR